MSRPDPLIMSADIARVAGERPEMGDELVRALYQHLVLIEGRQPTIDELREYVNRLSSLDDHVLRQQLGLDRPKRSHRPRTVERRADRTRTSVVERHDDRRAPAHADDAEPTGRGSAARQRGRPGWTSELFATRYHAAQERATPPYTYQAVAEHLEMLDGETGTEPDYLRKLVKRFGLPANEADETQTKFGGLGPE